MKNQTDLKNDLAKIALEYIKYEGIFGLGSGSTVNHFIEALVTVKSKIEGIVPASTSTEKKLIRYGIPVLSLNTTGQLPLYIDSADEVNLQLQLMKGGGGALTREKIIASASKHFICMADESKYVKLLGGKSLPVEVIPMACSYVAREIVKLGGFSTYRENFTTDNGNVILDTKNWNFSNATNLEQRINNIPGVVCNGLFAQRPADTLLLATSSGVKTITI